MGKGDMASGWQDECHNETNGRPNPGTDIPGWFDISHSDYLFGFKSMKQLRKWFTRAELEKLRLLGYDVVKVYGATEILHGDKQVAFRW